MVFHQILIKVTVTTISCMSAAILGLLYYRYLGSDKVSSLRLNEGNFNAPPKISPDGEWMQSVSSVFQKTIKRLKFEPDLDYFASWLNAQLPNCISYKPHPYAYAIDAFSVQWGFCNCYLFPPFSLNRRILQKIRMDQREVVLVVPKWSNQPWYDNFHGILSQ